MIERPITPDARQGIAGYKNTDYVSADRVLGDGIRIEELPDGIKFFLKGQEVNLATKQIEVNLYELGRDEDGVKQKRMHLEKFRNRIPEEEEIALKYGPNKDGYLWIAKWKKDLTGEDTGVMSDTIRISDKWKDRHLVYQKQVLANMKREMDEANPPPTVAVSAPTNNWGPMEIMRLMQEGEDRAFRNMERMAGVFKSNQSQIPSAVMERAYESAGSIMQKAMESNLEMGRKVGKMVQREMDPPGEVDEDEDMPISQSQSALPQWLAPLLPLVENWIGTLIGGGPVGAAVKTLILSSDEWKSIFDDKEKFSVAVQAMREHFGEDRAQRAIDILMHKKIDKKMPNKKAGK